MRCDVLVVDGRLTGSALVLMCRPRHACAVNHLALSSLQYMNYGYMMPVNIVTCNYASVHDITQMKGGGRGI